MLQRSTISSTVSADLGSSLQTTLTGNTLRTLEQSARLPDNLRSFLIFLLGVALIAGGMALHVILSTQILEAELHLQQLQAQYELIEQQNTELVWQIAQETSLDTITQRAQAMGYDVALERRYLVEPSVASVAAPVLATPTDRPVSDPTVTRPAADPLSTLPTDRFRPSLTAQRSAQVTADKPLQQTVIDTVRNWWQNLQVHPTEEVQRLFRRP